MSLMPGDFGPGVYRTQSKPELEKYQVLDEEALGAVTTSAGVSGQDSIDDDIENAPEYSPQPSNHHLQADENDPDDLINADTYAPNNPYFEYRNLVSSISVKLRKENALRLAYVYELPEWCYEVGPTHDPTWALRILMALEGKGVFAPTNLSGLTKALETIEREDLAQIVREFRKLNQPPITELIYRYNYYVLNPPFRMATVIIISLCGSLSLAPSSSLGPLSFLFLLKRFGVGELRNNHGSIILHDSWLL
jgi:hypothetical protein